MKTMLWLVCVIFVAVIFVPAAFGQGTYQELGCGHRTVFDPQAGGFTGVWVSSDPAILVGPAGETQLSRSLIVGYAPFELRGVSATVTWSCYFHGEMPQERKWELVKPLIPASYVQVFYDLAIVEPVYPETTWTPVPSTATPKLTQTEVPSPTDTIPPTETPVPEYVPFHLEFFVNGGNTSGDDVVTSDSFDLVTVLYSDSEYTGEVKVEFEGAEPTWNLNQSSKLSGIWGTPETGKVEWNGSFQGTDPIELWINVPSIQGKHSFTATVYLEDGLKLSKTVWVENPIQPIYLPLIRR